MMVERHNSAGGALSPTSTPGSSPAALAAAAAAAGPPPKVVVKGADMAPEIQRVALELAVVALGRYELELDMASFLKREFDARFQPTWHCVVGRHFGSFITSEDGAFLYFYVGKLAILLFKAGHVMPNGG